MTYKGVFGKSSYLLALSNEIGKETFSDSMNPEALKKLQILMIRYWNLFTTWDFERARAEAKRLYQEINKISYILYEHEWDWKESKYYSYEGR